MKNKELQIIQQLRNNAREKLTKMSRNTQIPVSTIFEHLKTFEKDLISKHTCLIDFRKLGYDLRMTLLVCANQDSREPIKEFLTNHHQVNTVYRINNDYDYLAEILFKNMSDLQVFLDRLDALGVRRRKEYYVLNELRREAFLTTEVHLELMQAVQN